MPPETGNDAPADADDGQGNASDRTRMLIHELAVGLTRLGERAADLRDEALASKGGQKVHAAARKTAARAQDATTKARAQTHQASERAADVVQQARAVALGFLAKAGETTEETVDRLQEKSRELGERAKVATAAGRDFYSDHREEILALLITAAKVAAVIGVRRLTAPRADEEGLETKEGRQKTTRRLLDATAVFSAVVGQLANLLAKQPSSLPMLREMYARGEPSEQAVVGMLLGPALSSDPEHAVEVVHEFLEGATSEGAADAIARRTLAPLLAEHPELVERVTPWFQAAAPFVRRAALLSLARFVSDRHSRVGDIAAAAVVVLEDHDEEVRLGLVRLFRSSARADPEATARVLADGLDAEDAATRDRTRRLVDELPEELQERVEAARTDREA